MKEVSDDLVHPGEYPNDTSKDLPKDPIRHVSLEIPFAIVVTY